PGHVVRPRRRDRKSHRPEGSAGPAARPAGRCAGDFRFCRKSRKASTLPRPCAVGGGNPPIGGMVSPAKRGEMTESIQGEGRTAKGERRREDAEISRLSPYAFRLTPVPEAP